MTRSKKYQPMKLAILLGASLALLGCDKFNIDMDVREAKDLFGDKNPVGVLRWEKGGDAPARACTAFIGPEQTVWTAGHCVVFQLGAALIKPEQLYVYFKNPGQLKASRFQVQSVQKHSEPGLDFRRDDFAQLKVLPLPDENEEFFSAQALSAFGFISMGPDYRPTDRLTRDLKAVVYNFRQQDLFRFDLKVARGMFLDPRHPDFPIGFKRAATGLMGTSIDARVPNSGGPVLDQKEVVALMSAQGAKNRSLVQKVYDPKILATN